MKVNSITIDGFALAVMPIGNRLYRVAKDTNVCVDTDEGVFRFYFKQGFVTNFRNGGRVTKQCPPSTRAFKMR